MSSRELRFDRTQAQSAGESYHQYSTLLQVVSAFEAFQASSAHSSLISRFGNVEQEVESSVLSGFAQMCGQKLCIT
jgi:hypothetical protein